MDENRTPVRAWAQAARAQAPVEWERMPELELYMDQVIAYMEKHLAFYRRNEQSKALTPSMINNYVKESLLHRPVNKRYNRTHLAELMIVSLLKPVLPMADIARLKNALSPQADGIPALYAQVCRAQTDSLTQAAGELEQCCAGGEPDSPEQLAMLAVQFALRANAYRVAAERMIETLAQTAAPQKAEKTEKK